MRVALISDTHHLLPPKEQFAGAEAVMHAGDVGPDNWLGSRAVLPWYATQFANWAENLAIPIYLTWGNHDFLGQRLKQKEIEQYLPTNVHIVRDDVRHIAGKRIWFSPWSRRFGDWAFMHDERELAAIYSRIPLDVHVIVSHGPPKGLGDRTVWDGLTDHVGSEALRTRMHALPDLELVVCGHVHEARGSYRADGVDILNVSVVDGAYNLVHPPVFVDF